MHSSATRLRLISRIIVITLVVVVGLIIAIHDHVSGSGDHVATPTATPASSRPLGIVSSPASVTASSLIITVTYLAHSMT